MRHPMISSDVDNLDTLIGIYTHAIHIIDVERGAAVNITRDNELVGW